MEQKFPKKTTNRKETNTDPLLLTAHDYVE